MNPKESLRRAKIEEQNLYMGQEALKVKQAYQTGSEQYADSSACKLNLRERMNMKIKSANFQISMLNDEIQHAQEVLSTLDKNKQIETLINLINR